MSLATLNARMAALRPPPDPSHDDGPGTNGHVPFSQPRSLPSNAAPMSNPSAAVTQGSSPANHGSYLPDIHRLLPASADAEKGVLSSFMLAPEEVGRLCLNRGIHRAHFHLPAYAQIYDTLLFMWQERMPIDLITLTDELRGEKTLQDIGGVAALAELATFLPTAANASYYLEILEEKRSLREMIRICTEYATRSYEEQAEVSTLLDELHGQVRGLHEHRGHPLIEQILDPRMFDIDRPPAEPHPIYKLGEACIGTPGNLLGIQAKSKAGKTGFISALLAAPMEPTGDTLGVTAANPKAGALIHFDTEQSPWHRHQVVLRSLKRAGKARPPEWLRSYLLTDVTLTTRRMLISQELERAKRKHGSVFAVIVDGVADLCADPNDPEEAFGLLDELHQLAVRYDTLIVCVIHENPGTEIGKTRGHLGSHLERKAETNLRLEKDSEGVTVVFTERARTAHIAREHGSRFAWSDEAKMHVSTDANFTPANLGGRARRTEKGGPRVNARIIAAKAKLGKSFAHGATVRRALLATTCGIPERSFDAYWAELKHAGLILQNPTIKSMWEASPEWTEELKGDFPDEEG